MNRNDVAKTPLTGFGLNQRVIVKQVDDIAINALGTVTRVCTTGAAWVELDERNKIEKIHPFNDSTRKTLVKVWPENCEMATKNHQDRKDAAREVDRANALEHVKPENFGKDHWSTFGYIETRCVDYRGEPDKRHMRCVHRRHPLFAHQGGDATKYPTMLKDGQTVPEHDDWDCVDDLCEAGLLENIGSGINPVFRLTERGSYVAGCLRAFKSHGGNFASFKLPEES